MTPSEAEERLTTLWEAVDTLLARGTLAGILAHNLGPLEARRLRRLGEPLPQALVREERAAVACMLIATPTLERVRASCDGPLVVMKGPEIARLYPGSARRFGDIDVLADQAAGVQMALVDKGFGEHHDWMFTTSWPRGMTDGAHHIPLAMPASAIGLQVEIHQSPRWPGPLRPPPTQEIMDAAIPSTLGVAGLSAPAPLHHALMLAAHAWHHEPLWTLRDLIDVAAVSARVDERDLDRTAAAWGIGRLWRTTARAIDGLFYGGRESFPLRTWARHLASVRDRTSFEKQVAELAGGYWGMPLHLAPASTIRELRDKIKPAPGESWRARVTRVPRDFRKLPAPAGVRDEPPAPAPRTPPPS